MNDATSDEMWAMRGSVGSGEALSVGCQICGCGCTAPALEAAQTREAQWQPIRNAPKDRDVMLYSKIEGVCHEGRYLRANMGIRVEGWYWAGYSDRPIGPIMADFWMPLPAPPSGAREVTE
jgi:hypothetical protein